MTPVYARVGRELIAGLKNRSVVSDPAALATFPIRPVGLREAIYWYVLRPVHAVIFGGMLREIARRALGGRE